MKSLNPYIDSNEVLRVGGRLRNTDIPIKIKHPIILGNKSELSRLIIKDAHAETLHGGVQLMLAYIRMASPNGTLYRRTVQTSVASGK